MTTDMSHTYETINVIDFFTERRVSGACTSHFAESSWFCTFAKLAHLPRSWQHDIIILGFSVLGDYCKNRLSWAGNRAYYLENPDTIWRQG